MCSDLGGGRGEGGGATLGTVLHVLDVYVVKVVESGAKNRAYALVSIVDELGQGVPNATVTGTWSGCTRGTGTATTDANGLARIRDRKTAACFQHVCDFVFTVTNVTRPQLTYDPSQNVATSGLAPCGQG